MHIKALLNSIKTHRKTLLKAPRSNREDLLNQCLEKINTERINTKYRPLTFVGLKMFVEHLPDEDIHWMLTHCSKQESFGKAWFGMLK